MSIMLITGDEGHRYHKPELSLAVSRGQKSSGLTKETGIEAAERLGITLLNKSFLTGISPGLKQARTTRGSFNYTSLVIALGAQPAWPSCLSPQLCWHVNHLETWQGFNQALDKQPRDIAIIGAGMVGCELAEDLTRAGHTVTVIDLADQPLANLLPYQASVRLRQHLEDMGAQILTGEAVSALETTGENKRVLTLASGTQRIVDQVVVATGLKTNARLAESAGLAFDKGLVVDPTTLKTSAEGIYALGDCISIHGFPCRFIEPLPHQAKTIASEICGAEKIQYSHQVPVIRLKTPGLPLVMHGLPQKNIPWRVLEESEKRLVMEQRQDEEVLVRLQVG